MKLTALGTGLSLLASGYAIANDMQFERQSSFIEINDGTTEVEKIDNHDPAVLATDNTGASGYTYTEIASEAAVSIGDQSVSDTTFVSSHIARVDHPSGVGMAGSGAFTQHWIELDVVDEVVESSGGSSTSCDVNLEFYLAWSDATLDDVNCGWIVLAREIDSGINVGSGATTASILVNSNGGPLNVQYRDSTDWFPTFTQSGMALNADFGAYYIDAIYYNATEGTPASQSTEVYYSATATKVPGDFSCDQLNMGLYDGLFSYTIE